MNESVEIALLLDFYGQLLTPKQFEILDLHYNNDFSLGEIGEQQKISRQGVHDSVKKGKEALWRYEQKLGLVKRFLAHEEILLQVLSELKKLQTDNIQTNNVQTNSVQTNNVQTKEIIEFCIAKLENAINEL